jgi:hypothetical protein
MLDLSPLESGEPRRITPQRPRDYLEILSRAVFNAGLSWQVVDARWPAIAAAFADFEPDVVAGYDDQDVERLLADERLIRSPKKLAAVPVNARTLMGIVDEHDDVGRWLADFAGYEASERGLRRAFRYIGEFGAYWTLYSIGAEVPDYREWAAARGRKLPPHLRGATATA